MATRRYEMTLFHGYEYVKFLTAIRAWLLELPVFPTPRFYQKKKAPYYTDQFKTEFNAQNIQVTR
jgi:hypothetical protein